jgi:hypothetical protein
MRHRLAFVEAVRRRKGLALGFVEQFDTKGQAMNVSKPECYHAAPRK